MASSGAVNLKLTLSELADCPSVDGEGVDTPNHENFGGNKDGEDQENDVSVGMKSNAGTRVAVGISAKLPARSCQNNHDEDSDDTNGYFSAGGAEDSDDSIGGRLKEIVNEQQQRKKKSPTPFLLSGAVTNTSKKRATKPPAKIATKKKKRKKAPTMSSSPIRPHRGMEVSPAGARQNVAAAGAVNNTAATAVTPASPLPVAAAQRRRSRATKLTSSRRQHNGEDSTDSSSSDSSGDEDNMLPDPNTPTSAKSPRRAAEGRSAEAEQAAEDKKKTRQVPVRKGSRVKARRSILYHLLPPSLQKYIPSSDPNYKNYYGTVVKKAVGKLPSYDIKFDIFMNDEIAPGLRRDTFRTVAKNEEEAPVDEKYLATVQAEMDANDEIEKDKVEFKTEKAFCSQERSALKEATSFTHHFANKKIKPITWKIYGADEYIDDDSVFLNLKDKLRRGPKLKEGINVNLSNGEFFLRYIFPDLDGLAAKMDEYYSDERAQYYVTVRDRKFKFNDPTATDPDWKLKQAVLLIINAANVNGLGAETYWMSGMMAGKIPAADFGQFMDYNEFRCLTAALPFMWSDRNLWYADKRDVPWDVFTPFIDAWNEKQQALFEDYDLLIMDETFVPWVPKASKLGGASKLFF